MSTVAVAAGDDNDSDSNDASDANSDSDSAFSYDSRTAPTDCFDLDDWRLQDFDDDDGNATETFDLDESYSENDDE